jgi:hypothetical protein
MCLCGCFFDWADLWTHPEIVGVDFRSRTEIGTPTLMLSMGSLSRYWIIKNADKWW